jgi:hypothetical protein
MNASASLRGLAANGFGQVLDHDCGSGQRGMRAGAELIRLQHAPMASHSVSRSRGELLGLFERGACRCRAPER